MPTVSLKDASPDGRWAAARARANDSASVPQLIEALALERDTRVLEAIFTSLACIGSRDSACAVMPYLRSDDAKIRTLALDALRAMPEASAEFLPQLLADDDVDVRILTCDLTRVVQDADVTLLLCFVLETDADANVCAAAVDVLAEIGDARALPALSRCAARFAHDPFLGFAIRIALDRLGAITPRPA